MLDLDQPVPRSHGQPASKPSCGNGDQYHGPRRFPSDRCPLWPSLVHQRASRALELKLGNRSPPPRCHTRSVRAAKRLLSGSTAASCYVLAFDPTRTLWGGWLPLLVAVTTRAHARVSIGFILVLFLACGLPSLITGARSMQICVSVCWNDRRRGDRRGSLTGCQVTRQPDLTGC